jgi:hypothetical protein
MDKITAGFNVNGIIFDFGDFVKINNQIAVINQFNIGAVVSGIMNNTATVIQAAN